ncbi:MAG: carboxymuconolactone decarboxylase family protein [Rhodospirillales bacterium]
MSRVLPPRPDEMTEAQQAMYDGIVHGPRTPKGGRSPFIDDEGRLIGPFGIWNIAPNVGDAVQNVGVAVRYNTSLPARVREIAILAVGAAYRANFEWYAHAPLAAAVGVSAEQLERLRQGDDPEGLSEEEELAITLARELIDDRAASEATMQAVIATYGDEAAVELVLLIGYYAMLCITLNAFDVDLPAGEEKPFG